MKKFEAPEVEVICYSVADVITTSNEELPDPGDNGMGFG